MHTVVLLWWAMCIANTVKKNLSSFFGFICYSYTMQTVNIDYIQLYSVHIIYIIFKQTNLNTENMVLGEKIPKMLNDNLGN